MGNSNTTYTGNITLTSQAQVDAYTGYGKIVGILTISSTGINDLSPLINLREVTNNLTLQYFS